MRKAQRKNKSMLWTWIFDFSKFFLTCAACPSISIKSLFASTLVIANRIFAFGFAMTVIRAFCTLINI